MAAESDARRTWRDLTPEDCTSADAIPLFRELVIEILREHPTPAALTLFDRLFRRRVWNLVNWVASECQAKIGDNFNFTTEDREDVFQHAMVFLIMGPRYQPVRKGYSPNTSRLRLWLSQGSEEGRLIGFISSVTINYARDLFRGIHVVRLHANEVTEAEAEAVDGEWLRLIELQPGPEFELDPAERAEVRALIRRCLDGMPEPGLSLAIGVFVDEQTQADAASDLNLSKATASRLIGNLRSALRERLQALNPVWAEWFIGRFGPGPKGECNDD
jgi:DNA-directed RNA polymerase specialized sigma24 family protein